LVAHENQARIDPDEPRVDREDRWQAVACLGEARGVSASSAVSSGRSSRSNLPTKVMATPSELMTTPPELMTAPLAMSSERSSRSPA
jgi:hypothetical protein